MAASKVAYFSMEIGLNSELPTYSGGLGVLAGDTLKSAADMGLGVVAVSLLYRKGYFKQSITAEGQQSETDVAWDPKNFLTLVDQKISIEIENRRVHFQAWRYDIVGQGGHVVPVYFLDTALPQNDPYHQTLTDHLYGGDERYRLCQEALLGIGGARFLEKLHQISLYHMNEGHAALLTLHLTAVELSKTAAIAEAVKKVKERCVFTTHTPVAAGHDRFSAELAQQVLGQSNLSILEKLGVLSRRQLNMTELALVCSRFVNGVAKRHGEVSKVMFPEYQIAAITNGVHVETWLAPAMRHLYDQVVPAWRADNNFLRYMCEASLGDIASAHKQAKTELIATIKKQTGKVWQENVFTIGFARRSATYKRGDLIFSDMARLETLANRYHGLQIVFSGKAHPKDRDGKKLIAKVYKAMNRLTSSKVSVVYLQNYDMNLGRIICAGVDVWLNNPIKPLEASGTSGMKAAINGVPSLSTLDGWWVEGHIEDVTGWEIVDNEDGLKASSEAGEQQALAAANLVEKLERKILPLYYENPQAYLAIRRHCIALNGSYFNTQRMMEQYWRLAYKN